jgi:plasmid stabilization system protein ParE
MKRVVRTQCYLDDLNRIDAHIARDNPTAGTDMWLHIDEQVDQLADPSFPRRPTTTPGIFELVAHENYIVILEEDRTTVTVLNVVHARQQYP